MSFHETTPLQIPSNLLKPIKLQGKDTLTEKGRNHLLSL